MTTTYTAPSATLTIEHAPSEVSQAIAILTALGVMRGLGTLQPLESAQEDDLAAAFHTQGPII